MQGVILGRLWSFGQKTRLAGVQRLMNIGLDGTRSKSSISVTSVNLKKANSRLYLFFSTRTDALWAAATLNAAITIDGALHHLKDLRGTIIIEQESGIWKIAHMHASFPDYRNPEGGSFSIK